MVKRVSSMRLEVNACIQTRFLFKGRSTPRGCACYGQAPKGTLRPPSPPGVGKTKSASHAKRRPARMEEALPYLGPRPQDGGPQRAVAKRNRRPIG